MNEESLHEDALERLRELSALAAYGELDAAETRELERLRQRAPALASDVAMDLEQGLVRLARSAPPSAELPPHWRERLAHEIGVQRSRHTRIMPWIGAAAGFVAGAFLVWSARGTPSVDVATVTPTAQHEFARFATESAPPLATAGGELAGLFDYLR